MPNKNRKARIIFYSNEHDDRLGPLPSESTRRVSFKNYGNNRLHKNQRHRARDEKLKAALAIQEDDEMMAMGGGSFNHNRRGFNHYQRKIGRIGRGGGLRRDSPHMGKKLQESPAHWYKVLIPEGNKYERDYIIGLIQSHIKPLTFEPVAYQIQSECATFYVDDYKVAQQIQLADKRIITSDPWKLSLIVRNNVPYVEVTDGIRGFLKLAMASRYNAVNKALDLTKLHADPAIMKENLFIPLNRANILNAVIKIIQQSIPDLLALNLSDNLLVAIDCLKQLKSSLPHLKVLYIGDNKIRFMDQFDPMKGLEIEELKLDGNPLCDRFKDKESYIREVQKRFPKVIKLDGTDIPRCITVDVEEELSLVPSQGSFLCVPAAAEVIRPFLQQYYHLYDSGNRSMLADAYHEDAQFSLTCTHFSSSSNSFSAYIHDSRNLLQVSNPEKRKRALKKGKANIVQFLSSLPKTQHDPSSLMVDCSIFTPQIIMLSVTGVFKEVEEKKPMKSFHRSFVIVPVGSGFCILNEMLQISPATSDQVKGAFKTPEAAAAPVPTAAPVPAPVPVAVPVAGPSTAVAPVTDVAIRQQMVTTLALQSGMNLTWAEKCLSENNWDFDRAGFIFSELHKQGKIPAEAFVK